MYSIYQRTSALSSLLSSCLLALCAAVALTSFLYSPETPTSLSVRPLSVRIDQSWRYARQEVAFLKFDVKSDLTKLFHWNTKQLFVSIAAEYTSSTGVKNEVVVWDRIVRRKRDAKIHIEGMKNKYAFSDFSRSFQNASAVQFVFKYEVMPWVGVIRGKDADRTGPVKLPKLIK